MCMIWVICCVTLKRNGRSFCWTGARLGENKACLFPQRRHGGPAAPGPGRAGPLLACRRSARLSAVRTYLVGPYCRKLHVESKGNKEILVLGVSAFTFLMLTVTPGLSACTWLGQGSLAHAAHGWRMRHCFHVCAVALTLPAGVPACLSCTPYT